ncbi:retinoid-inducible serine carboxypeptidase-like [Anoplolepis gracilipes]|uniref:retinoid-inducible serine carboxypeptidase-like n=1 Tax=Anoplolepis gracilipes TaxID=354296 RepID=UPI003B9F8697
MERLLICIITILCFVSGSIGKKGFGPGEQEWGFVKVRPYANMFWWLYYTTADVESYYDKPLIIWLQGGPGVSSTAYGNFEELGPLDTDLNPRNYTWVKDYNVLFIDNPVGVGFSTVEATLAFAKTNAQIASDLLECIRGFYKELPKFKPVPTYIVTESYGAKMGAEFALVWNRAQKAGTIESNLKGIVLGAAWISPIDSLLTWGAYLVCLGVIDSKSFDEIDAVIQKTKNKVFTEKWNEATRYYIYTQATIKHETFNIDFYNILTKKIYTPYSLSLQHLLSFDREALYRHFIQLETKSLDNLMNGPVKEALGLNVSHGRQSSSVFFHLREDFMKPVTNIVTQLLNETNLYVFVYVGQLDLYANPLTIVSWFNHVHWADMDHWKNSTRYPIAPNRGVIEGFWKSYNKFTMYWVIRAGHMVPKDNPAAMKEILKDLITGNHTQMNEN